MPEPALFLDRDGVLNERPPGDYVKTPAAFLLLPGAVEAVAMLSRHFSPVVVVTNQAGIGKGLMTEADLSAIHDVLHTAVSRAGGRIDRVYHCPHRADAGCDCRKPGVGMALRAQADFPGIDFEKSWMVGDSASDLLFGQSLGMKTALIAGKTEETEQLAGMRADFRGHSLLEFAQFLLPAP